MLDFSVPFIAGRVAELHQTVTANGVPLTLERVVVTPSETRATLRWDAVDGVPAEQWAADAFATNLAVNGWELQQQLNWSYSMWRRPGEQVYPFPFALFDQQGEWTLTVPELRVPDAPPGQIPQRRHGPWVFTFVVP